MSSPPIAPATAGTSTRPYLIRALHDWCSDNGFTPYVAVFVDALVQVPSEYVKNNEIVLNVGFEATTSLKLGNETIEFKARFGGSSREIIVPIDHVIAIYARENGQGMAFPMPADASSSSSSSIQSITGTTPQASVTPPRGAHLTLTASATERVDSDGDAPSIVPPEPPASGGRPSLKRVK